MILCDVIGIQALKALLRREVTLVQRNSFLYIFKAVQVGAVLCGAAVLCCGCGCAVLCGTVCSFPVMRTCVVS